MKTEKNTQGESKTQTNITTPAADETTRPGTLKTTLPDFSKALAYRTYRLQERSSEYQDKHKRKIDSWGKRM